MGLAAWLLRRRDRFRRFRLVTRTRLLATVRGARVDLQVHEDIKIGQGVRIGIDPRSRSTVRIGAGCRLDDGALFSLGDGELLVGERCEFRRGSIVRLSGGRLVCEGGNKLSFYSLMHCTAGITLGRYASTAEHVSIVDSTHHHDGPAAAFYENTTARPIVIGPNVWLASKSSVLMGVRMGANSVAAAHAVVTRDVPEGVVVGGVPAKVIAQRSVAGPAAQFAGG